jgi:dihydroneopterin aldolase
VRVALAKPRKFEDVEAVGVAIERRLGDFACPPSRQRAAPVLTLIGEGMIPSPSGVRA